MDWEGKGRQRGQEVTPTWKYKFHRIYCIYHIIFYLHIWPLVTWPQVSKNILSLQVLSKILFVCEPRIRIRNFREPQLSRSHELSWTIFREHKPSWVIKDAIHSAAFVINTPILVFYSFEVVNFREWRLFGMFQNINLRKKVKNREIRSKFLRKFLTLKVLYGWLQRNVTTLILLSVNFLLTNVCIKKNLFFNY